MTAKKQNFIKTPDSDTPSRVPVQKTCKLYINGAFPRTESGRYYPLNDTSGGLIANICLASRKDVREAVVAARAAFAGWSGRAALNRGQILYRCAELMESRQEQFVGELCRQGVELDAARAETLASIDRLLYYAGWCDKVQQVFSSVNPVASPHFNFSMLEPTGIVVAVAPESPSLLGLVSIIAPIIAGGNTVVLLASNTLPLASIALAELVHASDVPAGVINLLTGRASELSTVMARHKDVNALVSFATDRDTLATLQNEAADNMKRLLLWGTTDLLHPDAESPYRILDAMEIKTTWHPVGV